MIRAGARAVGSGPGSCICCTPRLTKNFHDEENCARGKKSFPTWTVGVDGKRNTGSWALILLTGDAVTRSLQFVQRLLFPHDACVFGGGHVPPTATRSSLGVRMRTLSQRSTRALLRLVFMTAPHFV